MKKLLNTLYVTSPDGYLSLDGENVVVLDKDKELGRVPLHNLEAIVSFGYGGVSPALMGGCAERDISLSFMTPQGRFLARVTGNVRGNVILRKKQYKVSGEDETSLMMHALPPPYQSEDHGPLQPSREPTGNYKFSQVYSCVRS